MPKTVLVTGDLLIQEHLLRDNLSRSIQPASANEVTLYETKGGAWRLAHLAEFALKVPVKLENKEATLPDATVAGPGKTAGASRAIVSWSRFAPEMGKKLEQKTAVWRVEKLLGVQRSADV